MPTKQAFCALILDNMELAEAIRKWMTSHHKTLSTAESCTSGRIAATLTSVSGSSEYYQGGLVVYQNWMKEKFLGVNPKTIEVHDVVSREVVEEMVRGCLKQFDTDYVICSTGYTDGGSKQVPSGTIWIGYGKSDDIRTYCIHAKGTREENTVLATLTAIEKLLSMLSI